MRRRRRNRGSRETQDNGLSNDLGETYDLTDYFLASWAVLALLMVPAFGEISSGMSETWFWVSMLGGLACMVGLGFLTIDLYRRARDVLSPGRLALVMHGCALVLILIGVGGFFGLLLYNRGLAGVAICFAGLGLSAMLASAIQSVGALRAGRPGGGAVAVLLFFGAYFATGLAALIVTEGF